MANFSLPARKVQAHGSSQAGWSDGYYILGPECQEVKKAMLQSKEEEKFGSWKTRRKLVLFWTETNKSFFGITLENRVFVYIKEKVWESLLAKTYFQAFPKYNFGAFWQKKKELESVAFYALYALKASL
jgi:hypothetical protein